MKKLPLRKFLFSVICILFFFFRPNAQNAIPPIGQWREHLNYQQAIQVLKGDQIYCATSNGLFSINSENETERFSKVNGLTDFGTKCIGWDSKTQQLLIAYTNSNIDMLKKSTVKNIGDIKRSTLAGNKTINQIYCKNGVAYLSSGLGIILADLVKYEIKDTWFIGNNGQQVKVNGITSDDTNFYAATDEGVKSAPTTSSDLSNYTQWKLLNGSNGLSNGACKNVIYSNRNIIVEKNDSLFIQKGNSWFFLYADPAWSITNINSSEDKILICQRTLSGKSRVITLNTNGAIEKTIAENGIISFPKIAIADNGAIWVADQFGGLSKFTSSVERFIPNGPLGTADGEILAYNQKIYAAAGSVNNSWNYQYNRNGIFRFFEDNWKFDGYFNQPVLDSVLDFITLAIDPVNKTLWAGSYGGGLVNFKDGSTPAIYKKQNSSLQEAIGDPGNIRISGLAFDQFANLWVSNYGASQNLHVRKSDGKWNAFTIPFSHSENAVSQILVDDYNQVWIVSPKDNGLFCLNYGQSIDNIGDDKWKFYKQGLGNGNLSSNNVLSLAKDKNGFIWVGTDRGISIITCASDATSAMGCDAILPVVKLDRFAGLLFKDELVQCITVDGTNRKWIGTKNGLWLISAEGDKIIYRFTEENSPLLSNDVKRLAIDPATGELFIATFNGICSFRSTATEGGTTNENVLVFPNPVPPNYQGTIAIRGLTDNALVKVTELNGRLVFQGRALGGQCIWNGKNYLGNPIASGVYLVIVRDDSGYESIVTKIVLTSSN